MTTLAQRIAPAKERAGAHASYQVALMFAGAMLTAGLAQFSVRLPFTPVPISGQTLGVLLVGAALGPGLGAGAMLLYLSWGLLGLPVFAPGPSGAHVTGAEALAPAAASAGYLWGFVAAAGAVGALSRRGWDRSPGSSLVAMLVGEAIIYTCGVPWLMHAVGFSLSEGLRAVLYPFLVGDVLKMVLAAGMLPLAWKLTRRGSDV
jgi:biotin transport system substrate-specific component